MFENTSHIQKSIIYQGLLRLVTTNSGIGFLNSDQGHPAYRQPRGGAFGSQTRGDSPEQNELFKMMHELSLFLSEEEEAQPQITEYVFSWSDFCRLATEAHDKYRALSGLSFAEGTPSPEAAWAALRKHFEKIASRMMDLRWAFAVVHDKRSAPSVHPAWLIKSPPAPKHPEGASPRIVRRLRLRRRPLHPLPFGERESQMSRFSAPPS